MAEHPHAALMREGYEALARADTRTLFRLLADDVVWHVPGKGRLAGPYEGKPQVRLLLSEIYEQTEGMLAFGLHDVTASDDHVVALHRVVALSEDGRFDQTQVLVCHVRDGLGTEFWLHPADQEEFDAFWS